MLKGLDVITERLFDLSSNLLDTADFHCTEAANKSSLNRLTANTYSLGVVCVVACLIAPLKIMCAMASVLRK